MKVLFVTTKSPLPMNDGHSLRTFHLLRAVAQHHEVTLLSYVKYPVEYDYNNELERLCSSVRQFSVPENCSSLKTAITACLNIAGDQPYVAKKYNQPSMRGEVRRLLKEERFDLVHLDMLPLGVFLDEIDVPVVLNEHNVESALLKRRVESTSNYLSSSYYAEQQRRLERFEAQVVSRVDHVLACSNEDRALLRAMAPDQRISVVPNGVDTGLFRSSLMHREEPCRMVFVGGMNWFPNRDAIRWFDQQVMPELVKQESRILLDVVGKPDDGMRIQHVQHVSMHGFVDDTRPYLEKSAVVIVPIRVGGGTRLKVLEAMSMGKALVSTTVGVEGIQVEHRKHVLIADTPEEFAASVVELMSDAELRGCLGKAARELVCNNYEWGAIGRNLLGAYEATVGAAS